MIVLGLFLSKNRIFCSVNLHFMKVSTEIDNNFGYEKITQLVDNIPLNGPSLTYTPTQNIYRTVPFIYLNTTQG
jgi:hypothetical protein